MVQNPDGKHAIMSLMGSADLAIASISAVPRKSIFQHFTLNLGSGKHDTRIEEGEMLIPTFLHKAGNMSTVIEYMDEAQGTQKMFSMAGLLLDIIKNGKVLVIDELDRSLHPLLVRQIVKTFQDPTINQRGSQLIFSTHDTSLLDSQLLRRDQVWLTEKGQGQSSSLLALTEFSPRKGEALERGYLSGRYDGVPILEDHLKAGSSGGKK